MLYQPGLFGDIAELSETQTTCKYVIKKHWAVRAGLHYDIRLQIPVLYGKKKDKKIALSFALHVPDYNAPIIKGEAIRVEDHSTDSYRREGNIYKDTGVGSVLHFDEGYFTLYGVKSLRDFVKAFNKAINTGNFLVLFDGYKMKGLFSLVQQSESEKNKWIFEKITDEYDSLHNKLFHIYSILPERRTLEFYKKEYHKQCEILKQLDPFERETRIGKLMGNDFKHTKTILPLRPDAFLPDCKD